MHFHSILLMVLISGVVFVNGWTDAPNAIVGVVSTKALRYRSAVWLAALCNLLGLFVISAISSSVAGTILSLGNFDAAGTQKSLAAMMAVMAAIIVFATAAWAFGIPSSESHALIAALSGATMALGGSVSADAWRKVIIGLVMSLILSFALGVLLSKIMVKRLVRMSTKALDSAEIFAAGVMAFMHGAQDGQKFAAVFVAVGFILKNEPATPIIDLRQYPLIVLFCGALIALGTAVGGGRIIQNIGGKMVSLRKPQSFSADIASGLCLLIASLSGIPMSTTHTKTTAIMGACALDKKNPVNYKIIGGVLFAWIFTFPACMSLGYIFTKIAAMLV